MTATPSPRTPLPSLEHLDEALCECGAASLGVLLDPESCADLQALYDDPERFRKRIVMARHGFGAGEYQYFADPLPKVVEAWRATLYATLAPLANRWAERLGEDRRFPSNLSEMLTLCAEAGQPHPTPLLLKYGAGDYNCLHQDLYGALAFPLQVVIPLSRPGTDYEGGAFVTVETRPRMQSRAEAILPAQGEAIVFATRDKPRKGAKGWTRSTLRHGVSTITRGQRMTLGLIFHNAAS
ncbi:MAG: 2OG-Fe(II) oxygenase [Pseudomonadota bacterium]